MVKPHPVYIKMCTNLSILYVYGGGGGAVSFCLGPQLFCD